MLRISGLFCLLWGMGNALYSEKQNSTASVIAVTSNVLQGDAHPCTKPSSGKTLASSFKRLCSL